MSVKRDFEVISSVYSARWRLTHPEQSFWNPREIQRELRKRKNPSGFVYWKHRFQRDSRISQENCSVFYHGAWGPRGSQLTRLRACRSSKSLSSTDFPFYWLTAIKSLRGMTSKL